MFCGKCGQNIPDGAMFCPNCGAPAGQTPPPPPAYAPPPPQAGYGQSAQTPPAQMKPAAKGGSRKLLPIALIAAAILLAGAAGWWFLLGPGSGKESGKADEPERGKISHLSRPEREHDKEDGWFGRGGGSAAAQEVEAEPEMDSIPRPEPAPDSFPEEEPALPEPEPEPLKPPSPVLQISPNGMDDYMNSSASGSTWAFAVMDVDDGELVGSDRMYEPLSSSALLDIPILYACAVLSDQGAISLDTTIRINRATAGRTQLAGSVGRNMPVYDLLRYMLQYSDNTASNTLLENLTFKSINETCAANGYTSVNLNNYILSTTDYTDNDNYVSCADLCGMLQELYSDRFSTIGSLFLQQNMVIQDSAALSGLGSTIPSYMLFMNLNGQKADKYNEVAIVDTGSHAYIIAFMGCRSTMDKMTAAARTCGRYVYGALGIV